MPDKHPDGPPWQWPEATWRRITGRARAGRSLAPSAWPGGARCAVAISFDADHDTIPLRDADESPMRISQGQYGNRQAMPRIRRLLQREAIPASFFYPAVSALLYPDEVRGVAAEGHEIGIHSWIHEANTTLPPGAERDLTFRATDTLERIAGVRPVGMRTASLGFFSGHDDDHPRAEPAVRQLADGRRRPGMSWWRTASRPAWWSCRRSGSGTMPFITTSSGSAPCDPTPHPAPWLEIFTAEFDGAWEEGGLFLLTLHPHISGHRSRMPVLEQLIAHAKARGGCWFATHADVARWCKEQAAT